MKLPALILAAALVVVPTACGSSNKAEKPASTPSGLVSAQPVGTLKGHFYVVGGPAPGTARPLAGTLTITGPGGSFLHHTIAEDGGYEIQLTPGRYRITASNGSYRSCRTSPAVTTLVAGKTVQADVACDVP